jgi:hypothetical protein
MVPLIKKETSQYLAAMKDELVRAAEALNKVALCPAVPA